MDRREELLRWIAETKQNQRRLTYALAGLFVVCTALVIYDRTVGTIAFVITASTGFISYWVTYAHNASHRQKLDELNRPQQPPAATARGGHRRWRS